MREPFEPERLPMGYPFVSAWYRRVQARSAGRDLGPTTRSGPPFRPLPARTNTYSILTLPM